MQSRAEKNRHYLQVAQLNRGLAKSRQEVSLSAYSFLFAEMVHYALAEAKRGYNMEDRLHEMGIRIGYKILDLLCFRERNNRRETRLLSMLTFISQTCWKYLFGHAGDLLKGQQSENEYMINDKSLPLNKFISAPRDYGSMSCGAYAAGIVEGVLCSAEFPAEVSAHTIEDTSSQKSTTILIKFLPEVLAREREMQS
ncbi:transport protein particle component, Bet3 domain-containing protein [Cardiosporidium cionae]|uniref:Trafficking protein particle complex subunit n=1 Tax=Cardiosporidium cionae TaxID=476202 RepID=A0ABQ7JGA4_9APIC|nr:transport protein particle component, Bet3 domain-containing protein [Cardiosporidium cionae]|eukprot:KAF8823058.1 transport protein particle component, Bet3 domain-containing protein [Cardiosporidium cionae]